MRASALRTGAAGLQASDVHPAPSGKIRAERCARIAAVKAVPFRPPVLKVGDAEMRLARKRGAGRRVKPGTHSECE